MFIDRKDGALKLAKALKIYKGANALVLGIPRGGVETGYYVAKELEADFSILITRKLGSPFNPEAAIGAVAEDGTVYIPDYNKDYFSEEGITNILEEEKKEISRRIKEYRNDQPLPDLKRRTVILVDDGIATGATLFAAVLMCKNKEAGKLVVAAPISSVEAKYEFQEQVDEVVILETPVDYYAVSQGYLSFPGFNDRDVLNFMELWNKEHKISGK